MDKGSSDILSRTQISPTLVLPMCALSAHLVEGHDPPPPPVLPPLKSPTDPSAPTPGSPVTTGSTESHWDHHTPTAPGPRSTPGFAVYMSTKTFRREEAMHDQGEAEEGSEASRPAARHEQTFRTRHGRCVSFVSPLAWR